MLPTFKRSHGGTSILSAPNPAAGHRQPMPPQEIPGQSRASLGQSLVESLLFSPGSWCAQGFFCALQETVSPVLSKFWQLYDGVNGINGNPSYPYMTPGKAIALTRWTFVRKVVSLLFNMLYRWVIAFLPKSKCLLISWRQSPFAVILQPQK